jgi:hypothetical protein
MYLTSRLSGKHTAAYWYFRGPYGMTIGEPVKFTGNCEDKNLVQSVSALLMEKIHALAQASEQRVTFAAAGA